MLSNRKSNGKPLDSEADECMRADFNCFSSSNADAGVTGSMWHLKCDTKCVKDQTLIEIHDAKVFRACSDDTFYDQIN
jgi:hypothetical protein